VADDSFRQPFIRPATAPPQQHESPAARTTWQHPLPTRRPRRPSRSTRRAARSVWSRSRRRRRASRFPMTVDRAFFTAAIPSAERVCTRTCSDGDGEGQRQGQRTAAAAAAAAQRAAVGDQRSAGGEPVGSRPTRGRIEILDERNSAVRGMSIVAARALIRSPPLSAHRAAPPLCDPLPLPALRPSVALRPCCP